ncbi:hypothetical protein M3Y96_00495600 [Aphelenchoides besseyi]|nr:hypothetical protein M3Y96_00495600 [Aphelenchoides besseyi]
MIRTPNDVSPSGVVMIVVAAVGLFSAFVMIVCLLALSRRRVRTDSQIESLNRSLSYPVFGGRPFPPRFDTLPNRVRIRSLYGPTATASVSPKLDFRYPPTYEEAVGNGHPTASNTLDLPTTSSVYRRSHSPPPAFSEIDVGPQTSGYSNREFQRRSEPPPSFSTSIRVNSNSTINTQSEKSADVDFRLPIERSPTLPTPQRPSSSRAMNLPCTL